MIVLLLINAVFDVIGLAALYPLIETALDTTKIQSEWYLKLLYDLIGVSDNLVFLFILSVIVFGVFLLKNGISLLILYVQSRYAFNISFRLSKKMFYHYYNQGFLYIKDSDSGKKVYNIINIPYIFASNYLVQVLILTTELTVLFILFLGILFYKPSAISILLLIIIPMFLLVYQFTKNKVKAIGDQRNQLFPKSYALVWDSMAAYTDVKLSNKEQLFLDNYGKVQHRINHLDALNTGIYGKISQKLNDIVLSLGVMVVIGIALLFKESSQDILTILSIFALAAYRFLPAVNRIMQSILAIKNTSYVYDELKVVINKPEVVFEEIVPIDFKSNILFSDIHYNYPKSNQKILSNITFELKKGETIGFVGESGSGKTTLLNIFLRFLEETKGKIVVDDNILTTTNKAAFQKIIGYVQQNVFIKNGTLEENIAFGELKEEIDFEKIKSVLEQSMLTPFVKNHPDGLQMQLGENGVKLSGGQKQRIGIARALYKDSQILVFDEATSALDSSTEQTIVETINNLTKLNKTIVIVAHRITTLEKCNRIYELENGFIKRVLTYETLFDENYATN